MWWIIAAAVLACWTLLPLPLAVAVGRALAQAERTEEPRQLELV